MTKPIIGAAVLLKQMDTVRNWAFEHDRPLEIQDFVSSDVIAGDTADMVFAWQRALDGHKGPRGIHGPFYGLDLSNPDRDIRAIIQKRLIAGVEICASLSGDMMVVHSPFTFWHTLNYSNFSGIRDNLMTACADCLAPVLERAKEHGVVVVLENIDDTTPADRADLADRISHTHFRLSVDTGHADLAHGNYGGPPVTDVIAHAGGRLAHVHLQDVDGYADRHWHPGDGRIPWRPVMQALEKHPGNPRLLLEVRDRSDRLPTTAAWLEKMFDQPNA